MFSDERYQTFGGAHVEAVSFRLSANDIINKVLADCPPHEIANHFTGADC
jgi:hypothetical protein